MGNYRPKVQPYTWKYENGKTRDGYRLMMGTGFVFIPEERIYEVSDALIDAHEQKEH